MSQKKLFKLEGVIQNYAWGGDKFIPELVGAEVEANTPYAEYWMGAHSKAPSTLEDGRTLDQVVAKDVEGLLGKDVAEKFGRLPYLFKVLDVKQMLSIQVHPTKEEAEKGFKAENEAGIPLTASNRNYKDDNHKPEIMVALSDFWLLHGFRPENEIIEVLNEVPEFEYLLPVFEEGGYYGLYKAVMELSQEEINEKLSSLVERVLPAYKANELDKSSADYWTGKAVVESNESKDLDRGIFSIYFFNIVKTKKGDAVFQDAGIPHAYLEGQNMELMANSDNVLRGGLTPKHVDVPELLKHVTFEAVNPNVMQGEEKEDGLEKVFSSPVPDFELSKIELTSEDTYSNTSYSAEILFVLEGDVTIEGSDTVNLKAGELAVSFRDEAYSVKASDNAIIFKAAAPVL